VTTVVSAEAIPEPIRALPFVAWRYEQADAGEKPRKVPYNARTGARASVTDMATWSSFEQALGAYRAGGYDGVGCVLYDKGGITAIDLDVAEGETLSPAQLAIVANFASYTELSPSGRGLHVFALGSIGAGVRRGDVEVYSQARFITLTGNVYGDPRAVIERQEYLNQLVHEMGRREVEYAAYDDATPEWRGDDAVIAAGYAAANGEKFRALQTGEWRTFYASQSEADFAFANMLWFHSRHREQTRRLFLASPLGQREKAQRPEYVDRMVNRARDRDAPPIDFAAITAAIRAAMETREPQDAPSLPSIDDAHSTIPKPPGVLGDIAQFIYDAAPRPVVEIALAGAIGYFAGIVGRAFNISATGLNQYVLLLAPTGTGKEAIASGISRLTDALSKSAPWKMATMGNAYTPPKAYVGPADMASGQGLLKSLASRKPPCFVSIVGEFGLKFKQLADDRASSSDVSLLRALLDLYNKSGATDTVGEVAYSDTKNNVEPIASPAFSIIGESVPSSFYGSLNETMIANGLLPRFTIIEYTGRRVKLNKAAQYVQPSPHLIERLTAVMATVDAIRPREANIVQLTPEADAYFDEFEDFCTAQVNATNATVTRELWNRAHVKALKLAALVAVGVDHVRPTVGMDHATWAREQIERDIRRLLGRFDRGEVGVVERETDEHRQHTLVMKAAVQWTVTPYDNVPNHAPFRRDMHAEHIIPHGFFAQGVGKHKAFRDDRYGPKAALDRTIKALIDGGLLAIPGPENAVARTVSGKCYVVADASAISRYG